MDTKILGQMQYVALSTFIYIFCQCNVFVFFVCVCVYKKQKQNKQALRQYYLGQI